MTQFQCDGIHFCTESESKHFIALPSTFPDVPAGAQGYTVPTTPDDSTNVAYRFVARIEQPLSLLSEDVARLQRVCGDNAVFYEIEYLD